MDLGSVGKETMAGALIRATMGATQAEARNGAGLVSDIWLRDVEDRLLCVFVLVLGLFVFLLLWTAAFGDAQGISTTPPQPPHAAGNHSLLSVSRLTTLPVHRLCISCSTMPSIPCSGLVSSSPSSPRPSRPSMPPSNPSPAGLRRSLLLRLSTLP